MTRKRKRLLLPFHPRTSYSEPTVVHQILKRVMAAMDRWKHKRGMRRSLLGSFAEVVWCVRFASTRTSRCCCIRFIFWRDIHRHPQNKHPARSSCKRTRYARTMEESEEPCAYAYVQLGRRNNMHDCTCSALTGLHTLLWWRFNDRRDETMRCVLVASAIEMQLLMYGSFPLDHTKHFYNMLVFR
jgi:hypothetical protein